MGTRRWWEPQEDDAFLAYRERIIYVLAVVFVIAFLPFSINNFLNGRILLGIGTAAITSILAIDAIFIYRGKRPPLPVPLMIIPSLPALVLATKQLGFAATLWCFPALLLFFFVASRRTANLMTLALLVVVVPPALEVGGRFATTRLVVTMLLTAVFANLLVSLISELQHKLLEQARRDPLTGAFNRRHMDVALAEAVERSEAALALFDIDFFKSINDRFGHAAGDEVLKGVVAVAEKEKRQGDSVFRIGGEEFVVLLPASSEADAVGFAERLRASVAREQRVTVSVGVARLQTDDSADSWLRAADAALYEAKVGGRDRVITRVSQPRLRSLS